MDMNRPVDTDTSHAPEISKTAARQGVTGQNVRYVLMLGLLGVVVGFAVAYWVVSALYGA
jgi:type IV secretory pathway TrbD component